MKTAIVVVSMLLLALAASPAAAVKGEECGTSFCKKHERCDTSGLAPTCVKKKAKDVACEALACAEDLECRKVDGELACVAPRVSREERCAELACGEGFLCRERDDVLQCVVDKEAACDALACTEDEVCRPIEDTDEFECVTKLTKEEVCAALECGEHQTCKKVDGEHACVDLSKKAQCSNLACGEGEKCKKVKGVYQCVAPRLSKEEACAALACDELTEKCKADKKMRGIFSCAPLSAKKIRENKCDALECAGDERCKKVDGEYQCVAKKTKAPKKAPKNKE